MESPLEISGDEGKGTKTYHAVSTMYWSQKFRTGPKVFLESILSSCHRFIIVK